MTKTIKRLAAALLVLSLALAGCSGSGSGIPDAEAGAYSFVWMTDTQYYSASYPEIFASMTQWVADNAEKYDIRLAIHTGDVTDDGSSEAQWDAAMRSLSLLEGSVPLLALAGNKDVGESADYAPFLSHLGGAHFTGGGREWYKDGVASSYTLKAGSLTYLFVALGYDSGDGALEWARERLDASPGCVAVIAAHDYFKADGSLSKRGEEIFSSLVEPCANVRLVLCGHKSAALRRETSLDDDGDGGADRVVYELLADYQNLDKGGGGYLRLLTADEAAATLTVTTYSPYLDDAGCYGDGQDDFVLDISGWLS